MWEGVAALSLVCGSSWLLAWSGGFSGVEHVMTLLILFSQHVISCHQPIGGQSRVSSANQRSDDRSCEHGKRSHSRASIRPQKPTLHIFLLTFSHFMPFYVLSPRSEHVPDSVRRLICRPMVQWWLVTSASAGLEITEYAHFIWILIKLRHVPITAVSIFEVWAPPWLWLDHDVTLCHFSPLPSCHHTLTWWR